tara:strand:- start:121 stop:492 length:372 start_codon:yes stop_codon:yes gene_type:complete
MNSKVCNICGQEKSEDKFYVRKNKKRRGECIVCCSARKKKKRQETSQWITNYKMSRACEMCGYSKETHVSFTPRALHFHHAQGNKDFTIGDIAKTGHSINKLSEEMAKCVLLCARCHIEVHDK